jgi:hypothetical protein
MYDQDSSEIVFEMLPDESQLYFVVMGAPHDMITTNTSNDTWHGYPKHFRFPYALKISGGYPEGFQEPSDFRSQLKTDGAQHANGGGWVQNPASVSSSVYVAPHAIVLGNSNITGDVRIENTALVRDAQVSDDVVIKDNAFVLGGTLSDNVIVRGQAFSENNTLWDSATIGMRARVSSYRLHGDIEVGGDVVVYNNTGDCDTGVYYRMTNYYQDNLLECDGRSSTHPDNLDVNQILGPSAFTSTPSICNCNTFPDCLTVGIYENANSESQAMLFPNPASSILTCVRNDGINQPATLTLYTSLSVLVMKRAFQNSGSMDLDISTLPAGMYLVVIHQAEGPLESLKLVIQR